MIKFACPSCQKSMRVDDNHAGKQGKCPKCGNALVVPDQSTLIEFNCEDCGHTIIQDLSRSRNLLQYLTKLFYCEGLAFLQRSPECRAHRKHQVTLTKGV